LKGDEESAVEEERRVKAEVKEDRLEEVEG